MRYHMNGTTNVAEAGVHRSDHAETPYRCDATNIILKPLEQTRPERVRTAEGRPRKDGGRDARNNSSRLVALVPKPRVTLIHFASIALIFARFAGPRKRSKSVPDAVGATPQARVQDRIETCNQCADSVMVIACIECPSIAKQILYHFEH